MPSSLLDEGQAQLRIIGSIFGRAYVKGDHNSSHRRLEKQQEQQQQEQGHKKPQEEKEHQRQKEQELVYPLFTAEELRENISERLRVRSTDISRTLASGAFLLESFFESCDVSPRRVPVETHEVTSDPLLSGYTSPVVVGLREQAEATPAFAAITAKHHEVKELLRWEMRLSEKEFEALWPEVIVDCVLTYVCSGRRQLLPAVLQKDDFALVNQLVAFNDDITNFWLQWEDAVAAFASAQPLFLELTAKILAPIRRKQQQQQQQQQQHGAAAAAAGGGYPPAFSLYMTHDVTIMSVLAALKVYEGVWPSYASAAVFEVYEHLPHPPTKNNNSKTKGEDIGKHHLFRLVYNG